MVTCVFCANLGPTAMCSTCNSLWEEVTLLYSNMQGLLSLMGRRLRQFRRKLKNNNQSQRRQNGNRNMSPAGSKVTATANTRGKSKARNKLSAPAPRSASPESMLNWWYPSTSTGSVNVNAPQNSGVGVARDDSGEVIVKTEQFHVMDVLEEAEDFEQDNDELMEEEDVEIIPDPDKQIEGQNSDENGDEDDGDSNYIPDQEFPRKKKKLTHHPNGKERKTANTESISVENASFEIETTTQDGRKLIYGNHSYVCNRKRRGTSNKDYWKCSVASCSGRMVKTGENTLTFTKPHDTCTLLGHEIIIGKKGRRKRMPKTKISESTHQPVSL